MVCALEININLDLMKLFFFSKLKIKTVTRNLIQNQTEFVSTNNMKCLSLRQWTKSFETDFIIYNWFELITECIQIEFLIFFWVRNTNFADCLSKIICFPRKPVTDKNSLWDLFLNIRPNCTSNMYGDLKRGDQ